MKQMSFDIFLKNAEEASISNCLRKSVPNKKTIHRILSYVILVHTMILCRLIVSLGYVLVIPVSVKLICI